MNIYKKICRHLQNLNVKILFGFALICVLIIASIVINISLYYKQNNINNENVDINTGYNEEDLDEIDKIRDLFSVYLKSAKYDKLDTPEIDLRDQYSAQTSETINIAQRLLAKYERIRIDADTFLSFDNSRYITVTGMSTFTTNVNVDIPVKRNYYLFSEYFVPTANGSWCVYPNALDNEFHFFQFGKEISSSTIKSDCALEMIDQRFINISYLDPNEKNPYNNSSFYLFKSKVLDKIYIYNINKKKWKTLDDVRDVKVTEKFISLITTKDEFYVYCVKDDLLFKVGKTKNPLKFHNLYMPAGYTIKDIRKCHKCTSK